MTVNNDSHVNNAFPVVTKTADRWFRTAVYAVLLLAGAVYLPSIDGLALWDDRGLIGMYRSLAQCIDTPFLQHYFRPIVSISFFLEWCIWGRDAFYAHQDNLLIHVATTAALIGLLRSLVSNRWVALLGGLLFAVQPEQVSVIAWIGGRTDSLCALWLTLFLWSLVLSTRAAAGSSWMWTSLSALCFGLALFTKEQSLAVLPMVPIVHFWLGKSDPDVAKNLRAELRQSMARILPYAALAVVFLGFWITHYPDPRIPQHTPFGDQVLLAGHASVYYGLLFLAPASRWLHLLTLTQLEKFGWRPAAAGFVFLAGLVYLLVRSRKSDVGAAILLLYSLLAYLPVSNLVPMPSLYAAPYRVGICGPAVAGLMALAIFWLAAHLRVPLPMRRPIIGSAAAAFVIWCTILTVSDNKVYTSQPVLFREFHFADPGNIPTTCQYSRELIGAKRAGEAVDILQTMLSGMFGNRSWTTPEAAAREFKQSRALRRNLLLQYGSSDPIERRLGGIFADLANARWMAGDKLGADSALRSAFAVDRANPYANLIAAKFAYREKRYRTALESMRISLAGQSERYEGHRLMADILLTLNKWPEAEKQCKECIALEPWHGETYRQLAYVQCVSGNRGAAEQTLRLSLAVAEGDHIEERADLAKLSRMIASSSPSLPH